MNDRHSSFSLILSLKKKEEIIYSSHQHVSFLDQEVSNESDSIQYLYFKFSFGK